MGVVRDASYFAIGAHGKQKRKDGAPYELHLAAVADWVRWAGLKEEVVAAAWLHDVLEDTAFEHPDLVMYFGADIAGLVLEVTDQATKELMPESNRATRVAINRQHLTEASPDGMSIKLADLIDNTATIIEVDQNFARVYLREKEELLPHLHLGNAKLYEKACDVLNAALEKLGMNYR